MQWIENQTQFSIVPNETNHLGAKSSKNNRKTVGRGNMDRGKKSQDGRKGETSLCSAQGKLKRVGGGVWAGVIF